MRIPGHFGAPFRHRFGMGFRDHFGHPHCFRHTYRTPATSADVADVAIRLLMGHSLSGDFSFSYLTVDLKWLRTAQDKVSAYILKCAGLPESFVFPRDDFLRSTAAEEPAPRLRRVG